MSDRLPFGSLWARGPVFACILITHLLVIVALMRMRQPMRIMGRAFSTAVFMIQESRPQTMPDLQEPKKTPPAAKNPAINDAVKKESESTTPAPQTTPTIDWNATAAQVAADMAKKSATEPYRSLSSKPKTVELPSKGVAQEGIFPAPLHKSGEMQKFEDGETIRWINDRCYYTTRHIAPGIDDNRVVVVCKRYDGSVGRDLFDKLKPKYLRTPVESAPEQKQADEVQPRTTP